MAFMFIELIFLVSFCTQICSVFVYRCQGNVALPEFGYFEQSVMTFAYELLCAAECMNTRSCLGYFFRNIMHGIDNCIHIQQIFDCSVLEVGEYKYNTKVSAIEQT